jgi:hypothetical protein
MVYRPTVRYSDSYEKFVKGIDHATYLDRNQIIRLALFVAAHSNIYRNILEKFKKPDVILPQADWGLDEEECWKHQSYTPKPKKQKKPVQAEIIKVINKGGIKYVPKASSLQKETVTI